MDDDGDDAPSQKSRNEPAAAAGPVMVEQAEVDDDAEGDVEDEVAGGVEEDILFEEAARVDAAEMSLDNSAHNILHAVVDPIEWKTELERVGPKLRSQHQLSTNEWRAHVDQTLVNQSQIDKVLGETHGDLQSLNKGVSEELNRMRTKEKYVNNQFTALCGEFKEIKKHLEDLEGKSQQTNEKVAKLTNEQAEIVEKLEDLKENMESKDSGFQDTSPLVRIKASLQQVKSEVYNFDLRIGVVSHTLLAARVTAANRRRIGAAQKARQRRAKGRVGAGKGEVADDDSAISED